MSPIAQLGRPSALRTIKIAPKLVGSFLLVCMMMLAVGGLGIWATGQINQHVAAIASQNLPKTALLGTIRYDFTLAERDLREGIIERDDPAGFGDEVTNVATAETNLLAALASYNNRTLKRGRASGDRRHTGATH